MPPGLSTLPSQEFHSFGWLMSQPCASFWTRIEKKENLPG